MGENEKFEAGKYYRIQIEFVTKNNYEFSSPIEATINGKEAVAMTTYTDAQAFATTNFKIAKEEAKDPETDQTGPTNPTTPPSETTPPEGSATITPGGSGPATPEGTKPTTPESNEENKDDLNNPKTGDNIILYIVVFAVSVVGFVVTFLLQRKKVVKNR